MSRIGKMPVTVPAGTEVKIEAGNQVTVRGPKGMLTKQLHPSMLLKQEGAVVNVEIPAQDRKYQELHGLTRTLLNNMVVGVTEGYQKQLEIVGVGYRVAKAGKTLTLNIGFSHPVIFEEANGITFDVPNANTIIVKGTDKQAVGQIAAQIREKRPPEPYLGKGIKYTGEYIRRKTGKTGK